MASIFYPDNNEDVTSNGVLVCTGEDIDFSSSQDDAILEVSATDVEGAYVPMTPFGFTLNLEEAKALRSLLDEAILAARGEE